MKIIFLFMSFFAINCCTLRESDNKIMPANRQSIVRKDCCSDVYFVSVPKSEQPTHAFIYICKSFHKINFVPIDSIYKFKKESISPPSGVDTSVWNESNYIKSIWSIEFSDSINLEIKEVDFKLTEYIFDSKVLDQRKSAIPSAIFGAFFSSSNFIRLDSSVIYIQVLNPSIKDCKKIVQDRIFNAYFSKN